MASQSNQAARAAGPGRLAIHLGNCDIQLLIIDTQLALALSGSDPYGQHVAGRAVKNAVCSGSKQQCKTMTTMTTDNNEIGADLVGEGINLRFGSAKYQVLVFGVNTEGGCKFGQVGFGGLLDLLLNGRQVHWNVAAIGQAQWLNYMHTAELSLVRLLQCTSPFCDRSGFFGQIYGYQDVRVCIRLLLSIANAEFTQFAVIYNIGIVRAFGKVAQYRRGQAEAVRIDIRKRR